MIAIRRLGADDVATYRAHRLDMLRLSPSAFGAVLEDEAVRPPEAFRAVLEADQVLGAFRRGELVGSMRVHAVPGEAHRHKAALFGVFVHPAARRHGIGRALLAAVIEQARGRFERLTLSVVADNATAISLYEAAGFTADGREPQARKQGDTDQDLLLMSLPIPPA